MPLVIVSRGSSAPVNRHAANPANPANGNQFFEQHVVASLPSPWSLAFLPDGRMLVSERPAPGQQLNPTAPGHLRVVTQSGNVSNIVSGVPANVGVLDVVFDPHFEQNHTIYFSFMDRDAAAPRIGRAASDVRIDPAGIAVARAVIDVDAIGGPVLTSTTIIWHQYPNIVSYPGSGEPGGRLAFSPDGIYLFIAAGDRQEFEPVQSLGNSLGKIIRIFPDGSIPSDNPFVGVPGALPEIWSLGHRNPYGLVFAPNGQLWENEMGPLGGDELNLIRPGVNYGWPNVSDGNNYDLSPIPKPSPNDGFGIAPLYWTPVIAPSGMIAYSGNSFPQWNGNLILSGLQAKGLVIVATDGNYASESLRIDLGVRTRDVVQGPDGSLYVLTDQADGRIIQLTPRLQVGHDGDLNGDGRSDIVFRNGAGQVNDWHATASGSFTAPMTDSTTVPNEWRIIGRGDFDGDGGDDIAWRRADGAVGTWTSSPGGGFVIHDGSALRPMPNDWTMIGIGDFNGDGHSDLLWRNTRGTVTDWFGSGDGTFTVNSSMLPKPVPLAWHAVGTGDFDGDGFDDILWRNNNGAIGTWTGMANGGFAIHDSLALVPVPISMLVEATGDFNGDGRSDILWRALDGTISNWLGRTDGGFTVNEVSRRGASLDWHVSSVGDYNGDGCDDILWRRDDGTLTDWLGSASGAFTDNFDHLFVSIANEWQLQSHVGFM